MVQAGNLCEKNRPVLVCSNELEESNIYLSATIELDLL